MRVPMIWTGKPQRVKGRTLREGDAFTAHDRTEAKVWRAIGKAKDAPAEVPDTFTPQPTAAQSRGSQAEGIDALREQYENEKGTAPDRRWGLARLRSELGIVAGRYQRRDMRAED